MNKKFLPTEIYFGEIAYNLEKDGYYFSAMEAFIKKEVDGETVFKRIKNNKMTLKKYYYGTKSYNSVAEKICLADMMSEEKRNIPVSSKIINLYLLKYKLITYKEFKNKAYPNYISKEEKESKKNSR